MATTALALTGGLAVAPASAADMMSVGVGGYMEQWVGMTDISDSAKPEREGGVAQWSDSEIHFKGKLEADNGLTFSVKVELEGNTSGDQIDESQLTVGGSFGQIVLGSEDHPAALMHYGNQDVGVAYCGDSGWVGVTGCSRNGAIGLGTNGWIVGGDEQKIAYYTPRMNGIQFGAAYIPNHTKEDANGAPNGNDEDGFSVGLNMKQEIGDASVAVSAGHYQVSQMLPAMVEKTVDEHGGKHKVMVPNPVTKIDDHTWTNFGLQVGFGAFSFNVAYAENDGGMYDADGMKKKSADYNLTSAGAKYSDGPMAVSLTHMMGDADDGTEANATMLSMSYSLAPGVASKTSFISGEQGTVEGTAFVTGIAVGF